MVLIMIFSLSACGGNPYKNMTDEQMQEALEKDTLFELFCYYGNGNQDKTDNEISVHFPADIYDSEKDVFYDPDNETLIQFYGEKVFYDKEGNEIKEEDLKLGALLKVVYNGEAYSKNPIVLKAVKITVCD